MNLIKLIDSISYQSFGIVMLLIGLGMIVLAFMNSPIQLQIALGLMGLGFIALGLVQVKRGQDRNKNEERFNIIVTKLDEIQQELKKEDPAKGTGVAIADVLTFGLKYYADQITKSKKEESNE